MVTNGMSEASLVKAVLEVRIEVREELLSEGTGPSGDGNGGGGVKGGDEGAEVLEDLHGSVVRFLARTRVEARRGELTELVEHSLSGGLVGDGGTDVILFKKVAKTGKIALAREGRKGVGKGIASKGFGAGGGAKGKTGVSVYWPSTEFGFESSSVGEELEGAVVIGV